MAEPDDDRFGDDDGEGSRLDPTSPQPAALVEQARLRLLLDAALSIAAELTLDGVLARIVEISCRLTGAEYAALGVLRPDATSGSRALRTFLHHGLAPAQVAGIDHPPTGHGILGVLIDRPAPLRLRDLTAHPDSRGFPPGHPPMRSFLGVPVRIRDRVFGNLYLTEKRGGGEFTQQDEDVVVALAAAAGVAIENAHLYEEAVRREDWLAATAEITGLLSSAGAADHALQEVVDRARVVAGAEVAWLLLGAPERLVVRAVSGTAVGLADLDALTESSLVSDVSTTGRSVSTSDVMRDDPAVAALDAPGWPRIGSAIVVPLRAGSGVVGALALGWTPERADDYHGVDPRMPARYAEQAALALEVMRSRESEQRLALFEDRDRIGRDLHDLVVQRLFAVGLSLKEHQHQG